MKKTLLLWTMLLGVAFSSCNKNDDGGSSSDYDGLMKSVSVDGGTFVTFSYDSKQRVTKIYFPEDDDYITYTYYDDRIEVGGTYSYDVVINMNDDDTMKSCVWESEGYTYNYSYTEGKMSSVFLDTGSSLNNRTYSVIWSGGNVIEEGGEDYTYDTSVYNNTNIDLNMLIGCFGDSTIGDCYVMCGLRSVVDGIWSTNMISSCFGDTYSYETNSSGKISKITYNSGEEVLTVDYY